MYSNGGNSGSFSCKYPSGSSEKMYRLIYAVFVHSVIVISLLVTIIITFKIKKINKTSIEFSVNAIKKRNKEKLMTQYIIVLGIMQLIRIIQDQFYYIDIKINGYDESIRYIIRGFDPFVSVLWMFVNAASIILISKTLREAIFENLKLDIAYKKLFRKNVVVPSSHNAKIIQNINRGTKKQIIL
uniref:G_PROTEIN_RECEP_F1_2 domain-containing protein n=1 Tax=Strongyloides venezuelensis TaxID=75913 RepID=A0A0K0F3A0_STRVS